MKVLFLSNIPSPYLVEFFNLLGQHVELTVLYERKSASDRNDSWTKLEFKHFRAIFPWSIHIGSENALIPSIGFYLKRSYDIIIFGNYASPTGVLGVFLLKMLRRRYILFSEGGLAKNSKSFKELIKTFIISKAPMYLSACLPGDQYFLHYGAKQANIVRIPFTTLYHQDILKEDAIDHEKRRLRDFYHIPQEAFIIMTVGRFIPLKSIETLITASSHVKKTHQTWIVGEGPLRESYVNQIGELQANHIHLIDFMNKDELIRYYRMSDLFVMPSLTESWGLVILEAMSQGLPIITTKTCVAGLEHITDGINGFLIDPLDVKTLESHINLLIEHPEMRKKMGSYNLQTIRHQTFENMVKIHLTAFHQFLEHKL